MPQVLDLPPAPAGSAPVVSKPPTSEMMLLFDRLLTSGALYPAGHVNFSDASENFRAALAAGEGDAFVVIEADGKLRVGPDLLGDETRGVERVAGLMEKLGLHRITIAPDATEEALHDLATSLLGHRREADATGHLAEADFEHLPASIQVVPKVFAKQWAEAGAASIGEAVDAILDELSARGTQETTLQNCRETLQELFTVLMAKGSDFVLPDVDPATRPQDADVTHRLAEGARSVGGALRRMLDRDGDLSRLAAAIQDAADDMEAGIDRAAAQVLLKALGGRGAADFEQVEIEVDPRSLTDDTEYDLPLAELREELASFTADHDAFRQRPDAEDLFICLNVLARAGHETGRTRALAEVTRILGQWPEPETSEDLHSAVRSLLSEGDTGAVDPLVERIAAVVRERGNVAAVTFWTRICADASPALCVAAWPHLVAVYLADSAESREDLRAMQRLVSEPEALADPDVVPRLERLAVFSEVRSGAEFCGQPERRYFPVYALLLASSRGKVFGEWLQSGLCKSGPDRQMRTIATALGPYHPKQARAYGDWLRTAGDHTAAPAPEILDELRKRIAALPPAERTSFWLVDALEIVGQYCPASGRRLLERISSERRMFLFKAWPPEAREAAANALAAAAAARLERKEDD